MKKAWTLKRGILEALAEARASKAQAARLVPGLGYVEAFHGSQGIMVKIQRPGGGPLDVMEEGIAVLYAYQTERE